MPKIKVETKYVPETQSVSIKVTDTATEPVVVAVSRAHCATPHSVELRKNESGLFTGGRTEDWNHTWTIGAKTVEHLFAEAGHPVPANDTDQFELVFSPYTGELMAIRPKLEETSAADGTNAEVDETNANPAAAGDNAAKTE